MLFMKKLNDGTFQDARNNTFREGEIDESSDRDD
jgi:hypothetical protein